MQRGRTDGVRVAFYARVARDGLHQDAQQRRAVTIIRANEEPVVEHFVDDGTRNGPLGSKYAISIPHVSECGSRDRETGNE